MRSGLCQPPRSIAARCMDVSVQEAEGLMMGEAQLNEPQYRKSPEGKTAAFSLKTKPKWL